MLRQTRQPRHQRTGSRAICTQQVREHRRAAVNAFEWQRRATHVQKRQRMPRREWTPRRTAAEYARRRKCAKNGDRRMRKRQLSRRHAVASHAYTVRRETPGAREITRIFVPALVWVNCTVRNGAALAQPRHQRMPPSPRPTKTPSCRQPASATAFTSSQPPYAPVGMAVSPQASFHAARFRPLQCQGQLAEQKKAAQPSGQEVVTQPTP